MNPDPLILDETEIHNRATLLEKIPHVRAWCVLALDLPLSDGEVSPDCTPSCSNYRADTAGEIYAAGFRLPPRVVDLVRRIPRPTKILLGSRKPVSKPDTKLLGSGDDTDPPAS